MESLSISGAHSARSPHSSSARPDSSRKPAGQTTPWARSPTSTSLAALRALRYGDGWYAGVNFRRSQLPTNVGWCAQALQAAGKPPDAGSVIVNRLALAAETTVEVAERAERYLASTLQVYARGAALDRSMADVALVGTPVQIIEQVERYRAAGVTHIVARLSLDEMPEDVASHTIRLFGREVIPHFA